MAEEIGTGFWAGLKLVPDTASFSAGERALSNIANGLKAIGAVLLAGKLAEGMVKLAQAQAQLNITAAFAGTSTDALAEWSIMLRTANLDSQAFANSLIDLNNQFVRLTTQGENLPEKTAKAVGLLGLDLSKIMGEGSAQRADDIFNAAGSYTAAHGGNAKARQAAAGLVQDLLGQVGADYFMFLQTTGRTLSSQHTLGRNFNFTNARDTAGVQESVANLNTILAGFQSIEKQFSQRFMKDMNPAFQLLMKYLVDNKDSITFTINTIADAFAKIAGFIGQLGVPAAFKFLDAVANILGLVTGSETLPQARLRAMYDMEQMFGTQYTLGDVEERAKGALTRAPLRPGQRFEGAPLPPPWLKVTVGIDKNTGQLYVADPKTGVMIDYAGSVSTQK